MDGFEGYPEGCLPLPPSMAEPSIPDTVRTILVYGGSFDPPHIGHLELAIRSRDAAGLDWLLVIPAGQSPHKAESPRFSDEDRLAFVRSMFRDEDRISVSRMEIDRRTRRPSEPSYTVDTLHTLRGFLPLGVELRLLIGADQALSLHWWSEPMAIIALADPVVMRRTGSEESPLALAERIAANWSGSEHGVGVQDWERRIVDVPLVEASSTQVRSLLDTPPSDDRDSKLRSLLAPSVYERVLAIEQDR